MRFLSIYNIDTTVLENVCVLFYVQTQLLIVSFIRHF